MPSGKHKSRTLRRVFVKTPGKKLVVHYRKRNINFILRHIRVLHIYFFPYTVNLLNQKINLIKKQPKIHLPNPSLTRGGLKNHDVFCKGPKDCDKGRNLAVAVPAPHPRQYRAVALAECEWGLPDQLQLLRAGHPQQQEIR